jgi:hypothetical protein
MVAKLTVHKKVFFNFLSCSLPSKLGKMCLSSQKMYRQQSKWVAKIADLDANFESIKKV